MGLTNKYKNGMRVVFTGKGLTDEAKKDLFYPPIGTRGVIAKADGTTNPGIVWDNFIPRVSCRFGRWPGAYYSDYCWELVEPCDKILITRDKKDPMRVIARDLGTNKTAEARCNPQDTFKFETGARLALDRLLGAEPTEKKAPGWSGRITPVDARSVYWTNGRIYEVKDGVICDDDGDSRFFTGDCPVTDFADLQSRIPFKILEIKD